MTATHCDAARHGTDSAYRNHRCRCATALHNHNVANKRRKLARLRAGRPLTISPAGTRRRLQALNRIGWPLEKVAQRTGTDRTTLSRIATGDHTHVRLSTATAVRRVYSELLTEDGPSKRTANRAARLGWAPPEAWTDARIDDPTARPWQCLRGAHPETDARESEIRVERLCDGKPVLGPTAAERRDAIRTLNSRGHNDQQIADRIGMTPRSVVRIRCGELGLPAVPDAHLSAGAA